MIRVILWGWRSVVGAGVVNHRHSVGVPDTYSGIAGGGTGEYVASFIAKFFSANVPDEMSNGLCAAAQTARSGGLNGLSWGRHLSRGSSGTQGGKPLLVQSIEMNKLERVLRVALAVPATWLAGYVVHWVRGFVHATWSLTIPPLIYEVILVIAVVGAMWAVAGSVINDLKAGANRRKEQGRK